MSKFLKLAILTSVLATPTFADENWSGFYLGAQFGISDLSYDDTDSAYGIHAGYDHDFGSFVLGGEVDYTTSKYSIGTLRDNVDTTRFKIRGGYDLGSTMIYGVVGAANVDSFNGYTLGIGASYKVTDKVILSAEYLRDTIDVSNINLDVDSFALRASYRF